MGYIVVSGGKPLHGKVCVSGNKNALLPMVCASLLVDEETILKNCPPINDLIQIGEFFKSLGSTFDVDKKNQLAKVQHYLKSFNIKKNKMLLPAHIRSSVLLLAPILIRYGTIDFNNTIGGCALGKREIDPHLDIISKFGVTIDQSDTGFSLTTPDTLKPCNIWSEYQSVTATETFLMMAISTKGVSTLVNAACEPHVQEFAQYLISMGALIEGIGTSTLVVTGGIKLKATAFRVPDDHHEIATFAAIGAATGGRIEIESESTKYMPLIVQTFQKIGLNVNIEGQKVITGQSLKVVRKPYTSDLIQKVEAAPWPYIPADILPQIIGASIGCIGEVMFWNKIYEGALFWTSELSKFGVRSHLSDPHRLVLLNSAASLRPAVVEAPYIIRVVIGLLVSALQINGQSIIKNAEPLKRAHTDFIEKLIGIGANVAWHDGNFENEMHL